ncbi:hypothetical protein [Nocardia nova]
MQYYKVPTEIPDDSDCIDCDACRRSTAYKVADIIDSNDRICGAERRCRDCGYEFDLLA